MSLNRRIVARTRAISLAAEALRAKALISLVSVLGLALISANAAWLSTT